jgi:hypothetical protein
MNNFILCGIIMTILIITIISSIFIYKTIKEGFNADTMKNNLVNIFIKNRTLSDKKKKITYCAIDKLLANNSPTKIGFFTAIQNIQSNSSDITKLKKSVVTILPKLDIYQQGYIEGIIEMLIPNSTLTEELNKMSEIYKSCEIP